MKWAKIPSCRSTRKVGSGCETQASSESFMMLFLIFDNPLSLMSQCSIYSSNSSIAAFLMTTPLVPFHAHIFEILDFFGTPNRP